MQTKKTTLCSLISTLVLMTACSGGSGVSTTTTSPSSTTNTTIASTSSSNTQANPNTVATGTSEIFASPEELFASYLKIIEASTKSDFAFIKTEYAKGLRTIAIKADNFFGEFSANGTLANINATASNAIENSGTLGLMAKNNTTTMNYSQRLEILDKTIQEIFIYSIRWRVKDIILNHQINNIQDLNTIDRAKQCSDYFFGGSQDKLRKYSLAYVSQTIDSESNLSSKSYDTIFRGLQTLTTYAQTNVNNVKIAQAYIDIGFYKFLYFATLEKIAIAEDLKTKNPVDAITNLDSAQYYFAGIMEPAKTSNTTDNTNLKIMLSNTNFINFDYDKMRKIMTQGFYERAVEEMTNSIKKIESDHTQAEISALSAKLYIDIIASSYSYLGHTREANASINSDIAKFRLAINQNKANVAEAYRLRIKQTYEASIN